MDPIDAYTTGLDDAEVGDALRKMVALGILEVVEDTGDPFTSRYRMPDPEGVERALDELAGDAA